MRMITEQEVGAVLGYTDAVAALRAAFTQMGSGQAAVLARGRAGANHDGAALMVSAMGACLPVQDVLGTKVYATRNGQFQFVITLFSARTGLPLATLEANELTRLRTAATTALAVNTLARPDARVLAIFGAGTQAEAHADALRECWGFERVLVVARSGAAEFAARIGAHAVDAATALAEADVIVTCTRAAEPLFDGALVRPGTLVCAVGSSKPAARELDDALLARAALVAVEWKPAAEQEAGEFVRAAAGAIAPGKVVELGSLLAAPRPLGRDAIVVYKSVGIGLEDVAIAHWVFKKLEAA
ncbi:MAG: ornithine cyclodeaminase family protein [Pelomonas sp.]|nr:ornithine cyclodeaminase family protein [Roseateles sp.]